MELINTNATAYDSWLSANMSSLRKAIEHLEEPNTNDIIEVTGRMIWQAVQTSVAPEGFEQAYSEIFSPIVKRPYPRLENGDYKYIEIDQGWKLWQAATAQAVPEGFVLVKMDDLDLEDALLQYRRQHNIFEPDDYIIHDGELKVFAMWSSAVEGCAYIGYAYAENGEMAHKDEFRHATGEEIKAGKRLEVK